MASETPIPEALADAQAEIARRRRVLLATVKDLTPSGWHESAATIAALDRAKAVLTPRERRAFTAWLAGLDRPSGA